MIFFLFWAQYHAHPTSNSTIAILKRTNGKNEKDRREKKTTQNEISTMSCVYNTVSVYKRARSRTWIILWRLSHCCVFALIAWSFWRTVDASYVYSSSSRSSLSTSRRIVRVSRVHRIAADNSHNRCHCESEHIPIEWILATLTHTNTENALWFFLLFTGCADVLDDRICVFVYTRRIWLLMECL